MKVYDNASYQLNAGTKLSITKELKHLICTKKINYKYTLPSGTASCKHIITQH